MRRECASGHRDVTAGGSMPCEESGFYFEHDVKLSEVLSRRTFSDLHFQRQPPAAVVSGLRGQEGPDSEAARAGEGWGARAEARRAARCGHSQRAS